MIAAPVASTLNAAFGDKQGLGDQHVNSGCPLFVAFAENSRAELRLCGGDGAVSSQLTTGGGKPGQGMPCIAFNSRQDPEVTDDRTGPLDTCSPQAQAVAYGGSSRSYVQQSWAVRRLTPMECERLQAMADNYTAVPTPRTRTIKADMARYMAGHGLDVWRDNKGRWRTNIMADGPRYKMLGNSMAVNVMEWIAHRIQAVEGTTPTGP